MGMDGRGNGKVRFMHQTAKGHLQGQNLLGLQAESSSETCEVQGFSFKIERGHSSEHHSSPSSLRTFWSGVRLDLSCQRLAQVWAQSNPVSGDFRYSLSRLPNSWQDWALRGWLNFHLYQHTFFAQPDGPHPVSMKDWLTSLHGSTKTG